MRFCIGEHTWRVRGTVTSHSGQVFIATVECLNCPEVIDLEIPITDIMKGDYIVWKHSESNL